VFIKGLREGSVAIPGVTASLNSENGEASLRGGEARGECYVDAEAFLDDFGLICVPSNNFHEGVLHFRVFAGRLAPYLLVLDSA
jgi:hypothetical protein